MKVVKLTEENINEHIGRYILYRSGGKLHMSTFKSINKSGKTIVIDNNPDLNNCLHISRTIYAILEW